MLKIFLLFIFFTLFSYSYSTISEEKFNNFSCPSDSYAITSVSEVSNEEACSYRAVGQKWYSHNYENTYNYYAYEDLFLTETVVWNWKCRFTMQRTLKSCSEPCEENQQRNDEGVCEEIPEPCPDGEVRTDTGECVAEEETYECREGYTEQISVGINVIPAPCSSFDPTLYSDSYTAVAETDTTHQVCCVKPLPEPESNNNPDTNTTPIDLTPTNEILEDIKENANSASSTNNDNLEQIDEDIKATNARLEEVNNVLASIHADNNQNSTSQNSNADANTDRQINNDNALANQAHQDQLTNQGKYDEIILNLRTVTPAINTMTANANANSQREIDNANANADQAHQDAQNSDTQNQENADRNHENLSDIKDALTDGKDDADTDLIGLKDNLNQMSDSLSSGQDTILGSFNALLSSYTDTPPTFIGSGSHTFSANVLGGSVVFDLSLFSDLKPYFDILFTLMLAWINFKIYRWVFVILLKIGV